MTGIRFTNTGSGEWKVGDIFGDKLGTVLQDINYESYFRCKKGVELSTGQMVTIVNFRSELERQYD